MDPLDEALEKAGWHKPAEGPGRVEVSDRTLLPAKPKIWCESCNKPKPAERAYLDPVLNGYICHSCRGRALRSR